MQKPLVFISHITPEKEIAHALRDLIQSTFMGMIDVFVSSDPDSIAMGGKWLEQITCGLKSCVVEVVVASPQSIRRPWINFEAGAGWVRDIPVIPICHSGMTPDSLPPPLSSLQAALATDSDQLERVLSVLAKELDCRMPSNVDSSLFIHEVQHFENKSHDLEDAQTNTLLAESGGLASHELATLVAAAECCGAPGDHVWPHQITDRMHKAGYRNIAAAIGLAGLQRKGLVDAQSRPTGGYDNDEGTAITINKFGWAWLESNVDTIELTIRKTAPHVMGSDEDIPF